MLNPIVIDISHWQPEPDFAKIWQGGTVGVIMKATEGTKYVDPTYGPRVVKALQAGLSVSSYHFLKAGNIQAQMDHYLKIVEPSPGERLCIDHEEKATLAELEQAVEYLWSKGVRNITIYSGHLIKSQLGNKVSQTLKEKTSLWVAHYTKADRPDWPSATWPYWSLWQYTDQGKADGIGGNIDANKWNGSAAALPGWFNSEKVVPSPKPDPKPEPEPNPPSNVVVAVNVVAPEGVTLEVTLNGKKQ